ncbi:MAG: nucleotide sugar dehydrogenase [Euryarchaeota archaeon]|nr:nucleotide sugar dehydrogenase [Euryarchaeota archaeon]
MAPEKTAVIGLGYVGIPLSALLASRGFDVVGIDLLEERVAQINRGRLPLKGDEPGLGEMLSGAVRRGKLRATTSYDACRDRTVIFVCVDTPIDADKRPDYSRLKDAIAGISRNMQRGTMVVVESTLAPGTMLGVVARTLERESGLKLGKDFKLAHCPERVMPGRLLHNITTYDRVIGALDKQSASRAKAIYSKLTKGELHTTDLTTAEIVKTAENAYRDVQIAFANEVALVSEKLGADAYEVRRLVNTCPFRDMHIPGAGVGGHCLPKDPWLLVQSGKTASPRLIPTARAVNDSMPFHVVDLAVDALSAAGRSVEDSVIAVMGASFLQDSGDPRNSPSIPVIESLKGAKGLRVHDPYLDTIVGVSTLKDAKKALAGADLAIFMVSHKAYKTLTPATLKKLMRTPVVVDGRNLFDTEKMQRAGMIYRGVGKKVI